MSAPTLADIVQDLRIETQLLYGPAANELKQAALIEIARPYHCDNCGKFVSRDEGFYIPPAPHRDDVRLCCDEACGNTLLKQEAAS